MHTMTKQELLKQADYTFQRGNRELAKKYLTDFLVQYPNEESAWMLMARMLEEPKQKIECYERALKINPGSNEAKIWIARIKSSTQPLPSSQPGVSRPLTKLLRWVSMVSILAFLFGGTSYAVARKNPESAVAKLLSVASTTLYAQIPITGDNTAQQTQAEISADYPQYTSLADVLIGFAADNADSGSDGAPEQPGAPIAPSDVIGRETKTLFEKALPPPGSLSSITLTEIQLTSWLAMEMKNTPDLPLNDAQVYLRNRKIQVWGMVTGGTGSTPVLIVGNLAVDSDKNPKIEIESIQVGAQAIPDALVLQMESWFNQMLVEKINEQAPGLEIMNININSGLVTISGMR